MYSDGKHLNISDNQDLFEIVKIIKDFTDKHFYAQNFKYLTEVSYRTLTIKIIQNPNTLGQGDIMDYHVSSVIQFIISNIERIYPGKYSLTSSKKTLSNGLEETKVVIKQN